MTKETISFLLVLIGLNSHLWVSFMSSEGNAFPFVSNLVVLSVVLFIFVVYLVFQLWPRRSQNLSGRLTLAVLSCFFIPLLVIAFAHVYREIQLDDIDTDGDYIYFSVVTFTTLGYGDITPTGLARTISILQAIAGFLFVPLLISQLINSTKDMSDDYRVNAAGLDKAQEIVDMND